MKTIGLLGGMSWESTALYYKHVNEMVRDLNGGGLHSAKVLLHSLDFEEVAACQRAGDWQRATDMLRDSAVRLQQGGADMVLICTNTMHKVADDVQSALTIPLLNIIDVTAEAIRAKGMRKVGLLGTKYTMAFEFYRERMAKNGVEVLVPSEEQQTLVNAIIFDELCQGVVKESSREAYQAIMKELVAAGAEAIILGCTEITLLVQDEHATVSLFDSTYLHAKKAVEMAVKPAAKKEMVRLVF
ncbi:MAG: aspartate/glutamate racemase family protein [Tumebacillaceae bacterium]